MIPNAPLRAPDGFPVLASVSVGPDQEACCLWTANDADPDGYRGAAGAVTQQDATGAVWLSAELSRPLPRYPMVQPHPLGWVVVGARCDRLEDNALVFDQGGQLLAAGRVGDGVEEVYTTHNGELWVSYFDEGVFGDVLAASGCVRWRISDDYQITPEWQLCYPDMADCYAMNVTDQAIYVCPYTDFPVIVIKDGRSTILENDDVAGPSAIVTDGERMVIIGAYRHPDQIALGTLKTGRFRAEKKASLRVEGARFKEINRLCGRGTRLHAFDAGGRWWSATLDELDV